MRARPPLNTLLVTFLALVLCTMSPAVTPANAQAQPPAQSFSALSVGEKYRRVDRKLDPIDACAHALRNSFQDLTEGQKRSVELTDWLSLREKMSQECRAKIEQVVNEIAVEEGQGIVRPDPVVGGFGAYVPPLPSWMYWFAGVSALAILGFAWMAGRAKGFKEGLREAASLSNQLHYDRGFQGPEIDRETPPQLPRSSQKLLPKSER